MARAKACEARPQAEPPHRMLADVEKGVLGREGRDVAAADGGRQTAFLTMPLKHRESVVFAGG